MNTLVGFSMKIGVILIITEFKTCLQFIRSLNVLFFFSCKVAKSLNNCSSV